MPRALQVAIEEDVDFRKGLPRDYMDVMGIANSDIVSDHLFGIVRCRSHISFFLRFTYF